MMASIARRVATSSLCGLSASSSSSSPSLSSSSLSSNQTKKNKNHCGQSNTNNDNNSNANAKTDRNGHGHCQQQHQQQMTTSTGSSGISSSGSSTMITTSSNSNSSPQSSSANTMIATVSNRSVKVKFGVPLVDVCSVHNDLPSLLLMMILKLNKEAPYKKDVFRAPGNQAKMKKLIQFLQSGRLVNLEQYSVHTIASVLKKFLRKLPNGIFGLQNEQLLFDIIENKTIKNSKNQSDNQNDEKYQQIQRILYSLPIVTQHFLVLLFGTFRLIVDSRQSSMTSESLSISVAPSFFHSCISDGNKIAKIEDVQRFKIASSIMKFVIDNFGIHNLFGQENYEYYSKMTGKIVNVEENWTFTFRYPSRNLVPTEACRSIENQWLSNECRKWNIPKINIESIHSDDDNKENIDEKIYFKDMKSIRECQTSSPMCSSSTIAMNDNISSHQSNKDSYSHLIMMESTDEDIGDDDATLQPIRSQSVENDPRLSLSMEDNLIKYHNNRITYSESPPPHYTMTMLPSQQISKRHFEHYEQPIHVQHQQQLLQQQQQQHRPQQIDDLKNVNQYAESTKSLTFLPIVHERQTQRMKTRSEWFLKSRGENCQSNNNTNANILRSQNQFLSTAAMTTAPTIIANPKGIIKKSSSKEKRDKVLLRRTSSKKSDKLISNDSSSNNANNNNNVQELSRNNSSNNNKYSSKKIINDNDCTERSQRQTTIKYQYKSSTATNIKSNLNTSSKK